MQREDHAKTKWCPFARVMGGVDVAAAAVNRSFHIFGTVPIDITPHTRCLGSGCAVWVPHYPRTDPPNGPYGRCGLTNRSS